MEQFKRSKNSESRTWPLMTKSHQLFLLSPFSLLKQIELSSISYHRTVIVPVSNPLFPTARQVQTSRPAWLKFLQWNSGSLTKITLQKKMYQPIQTFLPIMTINNNPLHLTEHSQFKSSNSIGDSSSLFPSQTSHTLIDTLTCKIVLFDLQSIPGIATKLQQ